MPEIIVGEAIVADDWLVLRPPPGETFADPGGRIVVPLALWLEHSAALSARGEIGVWLGGAEDPSPLASSLPALALVCVDFPKFTDGRGYSIAWLLRSRFGYRGQLRAIGDVLPDQLFYMKRVGFDAFAVREDKDIRQALRALRPFTDAYQGAWDMPLPAFRRHDRRAPALAED